MQSEMQALELSFSLITGYYYPAQSISAMARDGAEPSTITVSRDFYPSPPKHTVLSEEELADWKARLEILRTADFTDPRIRILLEDLRLAVQEQSKFALVHLWRAIEVVSGYFSDQQTMCRTLKVSRKAVRRLHQLRSMKSSQIAH
jgi:hypothetical protein